MPYHTQIIAIAPIPHLTSKMDHGTKEKWKNKYRQAKMTLTTTGLVTTGVELRELLNLVMTY